MSEPDSADSDLHPNRRIRIVIIILVTLLALYGAGMGGLMAYGKLYSDRVMPGVRVGSLGVGGMDRDGVTAFLQSMQDRLLGDGVKMDISAGDVRESVTFYPVLTSADNAVALISIDAAREADRLILYKKNSRLWRQGWNAFQMRFNSERLSLTTVAADRARLLTGLRESVGRFERPPVDASIVVSTALPLDYGITTSTSGAVFDYDKATDEIVSAWRNLEPPGFALKTQLAAPRITKDDIARRASVLEFYFAGGGITYNRTHPDTGQQFSWVVSANELAPWVSAEMKNETLQFVLSKERVEEYIKRKIFPYVVVEAQDAKFSVDETTGKVIEFQGSRAGIGIDMEQMLALSNAAFVSSTNRKVTVVVVETQPKISTGQVNNLGISEVLGVGVSNFAGSPRNRVLNIKNAVKKLNGILVPPGDEFSTIRYTYPFTIDGGYLPEKVIKGDEIKPEIGGGLCQIGSTLFRMAMNSGMPITERRNHSLVVPYYNDPVNKLPGTDATIYDPKPDFKFLNDTGRNVLLQTEMDEKIGELRFTLWGTTDGRKGYYSRPVVLRWIPYGETRIVETTKLKPGEKECQHAYRGADTTFTYYRDLPDGTKEETVYESHYRALPEICLVGVEEKIATCDTPDAEGNCPAPATETAPPVDGSPTPAETVPVAIE